MRFDGVSRDILPTQWGKPCGVHLFIYVSVQKWETSPLIKNCVRGPRFFRYPIFRQTQIKNMCFFSPCKYFLLIFTYHWECIEASKCAKSTINSMKVPLHYHEIPPPPGRRSESLRGSRHGGQLHGEMTLAIPLHRLSSLAPARRRLGGLYGWGGRLGFWFCSLGYTGINIYIYMYIHMYICVYIICVYIK